MDGSNLAKVPVRKPAILTQTSAVCWITKLWNWYQRENDGIGPRDTRVTHSVTAGWFDIVSKFLALVLNFAREASTLWCCNRHFCYQQAHWGPTWQLGHPYFSGVTPRLQILNKLLQKATLKRQNHLSSDTKAGTLQARCWKTCGKARCSLWSRPYSSVLVPRLARRLKNICLFVSKWILWDKETPAGYLASILTKVILSLCTPAMNVVGKSNLFSRKSKSFYCAFLSSSDIFSVCELDLPRNHRLPVAVMFGEGLWPVFLRFKYLHASEQWILSSGADCGQPRSWEVRGSIQKPLRAITGEQRSSRVDGVIKPKPYSPKLGPWPSGRAAV